MGGPLTGPRVGLLVAALAAPSLARADEPTAPRPALDAAPCVAELLDVERLAEALQIEGAAAGTTATELVRLDCRGLELDATVGDRPTLTVSLHDVAREDRPRVVALALAERPIVAPVAPAPPATAAAAPARPAPVARASRGSRASALVARAAPGLEPFRGASVSAVVEGLGLPFSVGLVGPRVLVSLWGRAVGAHLGAGLLVGSGGGQPARLASVSARFALAGPQVASGRLDVELGVEGGGVWARIGEIDAVELHLVAILTADLVLRLPLSSSWGLSFDLGYRRAYAGDISDLLSVGVGLSRALD